MKKVKIGIIGLGTVGSKVVEIFHRNRAIIEQKAGAPVEIRYVCDSRKTRARGIAKFTKAGFVSDWRKVTGSREIDIVVELIGAQKAAEEAIVSSLENGKNVVTANKALLAKKWGKIFSLARKAHKIVYFEASVGAGIPVIQALNEGLAGNRIKRIAGILNGTTNYILTRMFKDNVSFDAALKQAQENGFAEADPSMDIAGQDTLCKLSILSSIAWSAWFKPEDIYCEGINKLSPVDIKFAYSEFGYLIKLLGIAQEANGRIELFVRPCFIPKSHQFASVEDEYNSILIDGDASGEVMFYGKGAGGYPAASAVVSDIIYLARQVATGSVGKLPDVTFDPVRAAETQPIGKSDGSFYVRFTAADKPGVLSKVSGILSKYNVSISSVFQKEPTLSLKSGVPILMVTHRTNEGSIRKAIKEIDNLPVIKEKTVLVRIVDFR